MVRASRDQFSGQLAASLIPTEISAILPEHRGQWRTDGWIIEGEKRTPVKASWECKAAVNGVGNLCMWNHAWADKPHDSALDMKGCDPKSRVMRNEIVAKPLDERAQRMWVEVDGKVAREFIITHRRVK